MWLRLTRVGNRYGYATSRDGETFTSHGSHYWPGGEPEFVGMMAIAPGEPLSEEIDVTFDFFEVATLSAPEPESQSTE